MVCQEAHMKIITLITVTLMLVLPVFGTVGHGRAETAEAVTEDSNTAAVQIKESAVETGKAFVKAGKEVKEGSKATWKKIKKGVIEAGGDFKKACKETKAAIQKEIAGEKTE